MATMKPLRAPQHKKLDDGELALLLANRDLEARARLTSRGTPQQTPDTGHQAETRLQRALEWAPYIVALACAGVGAALLLTEGGLK